MSSPSTLQHDYAKKVGCTLHMIELSENITYEVALAGDPSKPLVICYHGFPSANIMLYKHQVQFLVDLGFYVAVPCLRGFGHSYAPKNVDAYRAIEVGKDIVNLVHKLGKTQCIAVAHDWGALQCWHHSVIYPDIIKAIFIVSIPCWEGCPRLSNKMVVDPLMYAREIYNQGQDQFEQFWYLSYHNNDYIDSIGKAEDEYEGDLENMCRRMISNTRREPESAIEELPSVGFFERPGANPKDTGWMSRMSKLKKGGNSFVSEDDVQFWVNQFQVSGFFGPVSYYRNVDRNFYDFEQYIGRKITQPCSFICGGDDGCTKTNMWRGWLTPPEYDGVDQTIWQQAMRQVVPNLQEIQIVPEKSHWILMEAPKEVNEQLERFLTSDDVKVAMGLGSKM